MPLELGIVIFVIVAVILILTHKSRKKYHKGTATNTVNVFFHDVQDGINENKELRKIGYWQKTSGKNYSVDTTFDVSDIKNAIKKELNISEDDFDIRTTSDLWVPHH